MTTQTMNTTEFNLEALIEQAVDKAVGQLTNRIYELEQKVNEQEQRLQQLEPKVKAPKVKELTIKELKAQAKELGVTDRDVKDQGSRTKKVSWQQAIELKLANNVKDLPTPEEQEQEQLMTNLSFNPYSVEALNLLYEMNASTPSTEEIIVNPF